MCNSNSKYRFSDLGFSVVMKRQAFIGDGYINTRSLPTVSLNIDVRAWILELISGANSFVHSAVTYSLYYSTPFLDAVIIESDRTGRGNFLSRNQNSFNTITAFFILTPLTMLTGSDCTQLLLGMANLWQVLSLILSLLRMYANRTGFAVRPL